MNAFLGEQRHGRIPGGAGESAPTPRNIVNSFPPPPFPIPPRRFVFLDEHPDSINDGLFLSDPSIATSGSTSGFNDGGAGISRRLALIDAGPSRAPETGRYSHFPSTATFRSPGARARWLARPAQRSPCRQGITQSGIS